MPEPTRAVREHKEHAPAEVRVAVITVSDSRDEATDESGGVLREAVEAAGHRLVQYAVVRDDVTQILQGLEAALRAGAEAVVLNGGTGVSRRDVTVEAVAPLLDKTIEGFGDLFRFLSFQKIGSAAMMSRALAGVYRGVVVFCLPGSPDGARLAWDALIAPELPHLVGLVRR